MDIQELSEKVRQQSAFCMNLLREVEGTVIGQKALVESILTGILADGHVLLEGLPGLAKTTAVKAFADAVSLDFKRIQFTPDLLPADLLGTTIYNAKEAKFETRKGPLFTNLVLADEINRAPSKVQSALLEAMQERHITIGDETFKLDEPFLVLATRDPGSIKRSDLVGFVEVGASPRASIGLAQASKAHAFIQGRAYVTPEDVKAVAMEVLRHRIILSYEAEAEEVSAETVVQKILYSVEVP